MRPRRLLTAAGVIAAAGSLLIAPTAAAAAPHPTPPPRPVVRSDRVAAPFNLDVTHGRVLFADGGLNLVGRLRADGSYATLAADQPGASGVATSRDGRYLAFTTTVSDPDTMENSASALHVWGPRGSRTTVDTYAYEQAHNPDRVNTYGPRSTDACVTGALGPAYSGKKDSHAYSVAALGRSWVVADAGSNTLLRVDRAGHIRTLAVLPPQPYTITADAAAALKLPSCVVGVTYDFEAVPTDVEVGRDGYLYITTLPGGPEDAALGARGRVWRVDPNTGRTRLVAGGFLGATNLAVGRHGEIYVAELFGGRISVVRHGQVRPYLTLPGVVAVETGRHGALWAATLGNEDPPAPGTIVKITGGRAHWQASIQR